MILTIGRLSSFLGIPSSIRAPSELGSIETVLRTQDVPSEFAAQVSIQRNAAKHVDFLYSHSGCTLDIGVFQLFEQELENTKAQLSACWTTRTEFNLSCAKLQIYAIAIAQTSRDKRQPSNSEPSLLHIPDAKRLLLRMGLNVSCRIIDAFDGDMVFRNDAFESPFPVLQRSLPKSYFRGLAFATVFLLQHFVLDSTAGKDDQELARNQIAVAYARFKACSRSPADECGRVATVIEILSRQEPRDRYAQGPKADNWTTPSVLPDVISTTAELRDVPLEFLISQGRICPRDPTSNPGPADLDVLVSTTDSIIGSAWDDDLMGTVWNDADLQLDFRGLGPNF